ncbi:Holliday junction branch migration protein RuvA [Candidatus Aerophobetes bacterium]|uniref:Holliday junction branch migration complex subunit RuvA n=1 Tax=Aerophobetes bacterium TaxID=2030807 RepID=A0A523TID1_UNCAE|nr:MAG: Holliday junction branch migration protein RuvA [Candidatus Aerophobetes bacterium]
MIHYLKGKLVAKSPTFVIVEVGGLGYRVNFPLSTYQALPPEGSTVSLYTHLHLRDDGIDLYGFLKEEEKDFFLLLTSLSKIGPKSALRMLSSLSLPEFKKAVKAGDLNALVRIPGIGRKTAQRMVLELKDKIEAEEPQGSGKEVLTKDAVAALTSLGYTRSEADKAVRTALSSVREEMDLPELIKEALRCI